ISAESEGRYAEAQVVARVGLPYTEAKLVLSSSGLQIRVHVEDEDGIPIEGANVRVIARGNEGRPPRAPIERRAESDAAGDMIAAGLVPGRYVVEASAPKFASSTTEIADLVAPGADTNASEARSEQSERSRRIGFADPYPIRLVLSHACRARVRVLPKDPSL